MADIVYSSSQLENEPIDEKDNGLVIFYTCPKAGPQ